MRTSEQLILGLVAHVDAGKTTLAESILYLTGQVRKLGRVDDRDTFLDTHRLERQRGITIFSKQAQAALPDGRSVTLLDTPGHADLSAETERTFQALDAAVLVISASEGVQAQTVTLWKLLGRYRVPTVLFVNKMDLPGTSRERLLSELRSRLSDAIVGFPLTEDAEALETAALCSETLMEEYLETGTVSLEAISEAAAKRRLCPCYFGSARKLTGVTELLQGIAAYFPAKEYPEEFGARAIKIVREADGSRLTYLKVTGGTLPVKTLLDGEKVDQIRLYSGSSYRLLQEAPAGTVCAVTGPHRSFCGQGFGAEGEGMQPSLVPVLSSRIVFPSRVPARTMYEQLLRLTEELPELSVRRQEETGELLVQTMGEVQLEILQSLIRERFGVEVTFGEGAIVYRETVSEPTYGVGHFEPLRHYAEVHLRIDPGERGSGVRVQSLCSEDVLAKNWQRLILTHLQERVHAGVLIGAPLTDVVISLIAGRAHPKHTEGGDFRQATYRAVRNALRRGSCRVLEPVYEYRLELPTEAVGRAMTDLQQRNGTICGPEAAGEGRSVLWGRAPVAELRSYAAQVREYTRGTGLLSLQVAGYEPCQKEAQVISEAGYDPEQDEADPTGSVFCAHGAGYFVPWDEVARHAHVESPATKGERRQEESASERRGAGSGELTISQEEIEEIFLRTYGNRATDKNPWNRPKTCEYGAEPDAGSGKLSDGNGRASVGCGKSSFEGGKSSVGCGELSFESGKSSAGGEKPSAGGGKLSAEDEKSSAGGGKLSAGRGKPPAEREQYLLVDGYNIVFAWEELALLAADNLDAARGRLLDILCNYQGYLGYPVIVVFDAYKVKGNPGEVTRYQNLYVVYTKEAETADQYIEKTVHRIGKKYRVTVATSDALEQLIIWGQGAVRQSARELWEAVRTTHESRMEQHRAEQPRSRYLPFEALGALERTEEAAEQAAGAPENGGETYDLQTGK